MNAAIPTFPIRLHCLHTDLSFVFRNYKAPHYAILVSLLLPHSLVQILPTLRQTSSVHMSPLQ
jgi:ABC-type nitrate/sulfonate/bicarbonate transport system permease component